MLGELRYLKDVATLELDEEKCVGCGICVEVCPHMVFTMNNGNAQIHDPDACMECGACAKNCPADALYVKAGVGCATAVINAALGRKTSSCCCSIDDDSDNDGPVCGLQNGSGCC